MSDQDKKSVQKNIEAHLLEIRKAYDQRIALENKHKKILLGIVLVALLFAAASIGLNYYLFPLKQTQPIIAVVDGQTGIVTDVQYPDKDIDPKTIEPLVKSYAYSYVTGRYGYYFTTNSQGLRERYQKVAIFSGDEVKGSFENEVSPNNPQSPFSILEDQGMIEVKIGAVTLLPDDRVQVDFRTILHKDKSEKIFAYAAIGQYVTGNFDGLSVQDKWLNPLGFKFVKWNVSQKASNDALTNTGTVVGVPDAVLQQDQPPIDASAAAPSVTNDSNATVESSQ